MTEPSVVDLWCGYAYQAAHGMGPRSRETVDAGFRDRVMADAGVKAEAQRKLASLTDKITNRDYISKVHKAFLERVLNG